MLQLPELQLGPPVPRSTDARVRAMRDFRRQSQLATKRWVGEKDLWK